MIATTELVRTLVKGKRSVFVALQRDDYGMGMSRWGIQYIKVTNHKGQRWESTKGGIYNFNNYESAEREYKKLIV